MGLDAPSVERITRIMRGVKREMDEARRLVDKERKKWRSRLQQAEAALAEERSARQKVQQEAALHVATASEAAAKAIEEISLQCRTDVLQTRALAEAKVQEAQARAEAVTAQGLEGEVQRAWSMAEAAATLSAVRALMKMPCAF